MRSGTPARAPRRRGGAAPGRSDPRTGRTDLPATARPSRSSVLLFFPVERALVLVAAVLARGGGLRGANEVAHLARVLAAGTVFHLDTSRHVDTPGPHTLDRL